MRVHRSCASLKMNNRVDSENAQVANVKNPRFHQLKSAKLNGVASLHDPV